MKRTERVAVITKLLTDEPSKVFQLQYFCDLFDCAKSSVSEYIQAANEALLFSGTGYLETLAGRDGGVRYIPSVSDEKLLAFQHEFCDKLADYDRLVGGNFMYTSDLFGDSHTIRLLSLCFARKFKDCGATMVVTVETKGIPLASAVAHCLNLPLVIIRREARISEGSTVSINYLSGSSDRLQKMSMAKRAMSPGSKVLIIDDFMRGGGTIIGISEMVREFGSEVVGVGIAIAADEPVKKKIENYSALVLLGEISKEERKIQLRPNPGFLL